MRHCRGHHAIPPFELQDGRQFHPGEVLHHTKHGLFVGSPAGDVCIAFLTREHDQAEGFRFRPKRLVIHRLKPFQNIVYVSEFHNETILSDRFSHAQILGKNQGILR